MFTSLQEMISVRVQKNLGGSEQPAVLGHARGFFLNEILWYYREKRE